MAGPRIRSTHISLRVADKTTAYGSIMATTNIVGTQGWDDGIIEESGHGAPGTKSLDDLSTHWIRA